MPAVHFNAVLPLPMLPSIGSGAPVLAWSALAICAQQGWYRRQRPAQVKISRVLGPPEAGPWHRHRTTLHNYGNGGSGNNDRSDEESEWDAEDKLWHRRQADGRGISEGSPVDTEPDRSSREQQYRQTHEQQNWQGRDEPEVDGKGLIKTSLLWALFHGPYTAFALPAAMLLERGLRKRNGQGGQVSSPLGPLTDLLNGFFIEGDAPAAARGSRPRRDPEVEVRQKHLARLAAPQKPPRYAGECPCGSERMYAECCKTLHQGSKVAGSPTELLRARYSAYVLKMPRFVIGSTAQDSEEWRWDLDDWEAELLKFSNEHTFLGLDIGPEMFEFGDNRVCKVVFTVNMQSRQTGQEECFTERSYFVLLGTTWYYAHGELLEVVQ